MTPELHVQTAEGYLSAAALVPDDHEKVRTAIAKAQVHATLATVRPAPPPADTVAASLLSTKRR